MKKQSASKENEVQSMNDPNKKKNRKQIETDKSEMIQLTDNELEKVIGGANFWFFDDETRNSRHRRQTNSSNGD